MPVLYLLNVTENITDTSTKAKEEKSPAWQCASCLNHISENKFLFKADGRSPFHSFINPEGFPFDLVTFTECENLIEVTGETMEYTWFPGYAWSIDVCAGCRTHLGWKYHSPTESPAVFYGLIKSRLISGD